MKRGNSALATANLQARRALGQGGFGPAPLPDPPEKLAGLAEEITYLRSRGFAVTAGKGEFEGWWKVDSQHRSTEWVRDKVASLKARSLRHAPPPVQPTGAAPLAIVSAVAPGIRDHQGPVSEAARGPGKLPVDYRGLGADGVLEVLQALRPHFASGAQLAEALGEHPNIVPAILRGARLPSAGVVDALFGPTGAELQPRWRALIAGGDLAEPAEPAGAGGDQTEPSEPDSVPQLPSDPAPCLDEAPAAEPAPLSPPSCGAAGSDLEEAAAGDGAAAFDPDQPRAEDDGLPSIPSAADVSGPRIPSAASTDFNTAGPGRDEAGPPPKGKADPAAEPGADAVGVAGQGAGEAQDTPASDISGPRAEDDGAPWAGLEDAELVKILRGKAAGIAAQLAALEAEEAALKQRLSEMNLRGIELEQRRDALLAAIALFEPEAADGDA